MSKLMFGKMFSFGDIFTYEYIEEDFGVDANNTIYYRNIVLQKDIFGLSKNDKIDTIAFEAANGLLIHNDTKIRITCA